MTITIVLILYFLYTIHIYDKTIKYNYSYTHIKHSTYRYLYVWKTGVKRFRILDSHGHKVIGAESGPRDLAQSFAVCLPTIENAARLPSFLCLLCTANYDRTATVWTVLRSFCCRCCPRSERSRPIPSENPEFTHLDRGMRRANFQSTHGR